MKMKAFAIYDSKADAYMAPFFFAATGLAIRAFIRLVNDEQSEVCRFPADYTLFEIGTFEQADGVLMPMDNGNVNLGTGVQYKESK